MKLFQFFQLCSWGWYLSVGICEDLLLGLVAPDWGSGIFGTCELRLGFYGLLGQY